MNLFVDTLSIMIVTNLCFALQICEFCPCKIPVRLIFKVMTMKTAAFWGVVLLIAV